MQTFRRLRASMAVNIIGAVVLLMAVFGLTVSVLGYWSFTDAFRQEYATTTWHMADTAATLVNGDHLEAYLAGDEMEEYQQSRRYLDSYCRRMHVSLVYVIRVDRSDYGRFVSVFNLVDNTVGGSSYTEWPLGHERAAGSEEYRQKYRALYEEGVPYETVYSFRPAEGIPPHVNTMVPVRNSAGQVTGILCIQRPIQELMDARRPYLVNIAIFTVVLAVLASVFIILYIRRFFVKPIRTVSAEAVRFARENTQGEPLAGISRFRELANLAGSIETMETDMVRSMAELTAVTAERERISTELDLARTIQAGSIPSTFPAFPDRRDFDVHASMTPAKEVGGDFYNFFLIDDDHLALVIGDVSGKGVPAALFMMVTNILLSEYARMRPGTPGEVLTSVNDRLCPHNRAEMFVTVWLGILELSTGKLTAANAGHEDPALCRAGGSFELWKTRHNVAVGVMEGVRFRDSTLQLAPGDKLFIYTDGVPEATDAGLAMFTLPRMMNALDRCRGGSPRDILEGVLQEVDAFVGDAPQFDDLTMLCLSLTDPAAPDARGLSPS